MSMKKNLSTLTSQSDNGKIVQFDYIRAIAAISVIAIHTINSGLIYKGTTYSNDVLLFFTAIKNLLYYAVPCFAMITGYLLCNPDKELTLKKIYGKYFMRILCVLLIFGTGFAWLEIVFDEKTVSLMQIPQAFLRVLKNNTWAHMWYLYALLLAYVLLPVWRIVAKKASDNLFLAVIVVMIIAQTIMGIRQTTGCREFALNTYLLMGAYMRRRIVSDKRILWAGLIGSSVLTVVVTYCDIGLVGYCSPLVVVQSYSVFMLLYEARFEGNMVKRVLSEISAKSFGIYLVHMIFVNLEYKVLNLHLMGSYLSLFVFVVMIIVNLILSYFVAFVLYKTPIKKLL